MNAGIEVQQPLSLKNEQAQQVLSAFNADIMVVVAYGLLLPQTVLQTPKLGCINVHASILPRWRGAAPIQRAIEAGDSETGITIMQMDIGLDTGDMLNKTFCPISDTDTASTIHDRLAAAGPAALLSTLDQLASGTCQAETQNNELATYAHKLSKQEAQLDWSLDATTLCRRIRAFNPFPVATASLNGERLRIHEASISTHIQTQKAGTIVSHDNGIIVSCGQNTAISIKKLQLPGKKTLDSQQILNGFSETFKIGTAFDSEHTNS
jgi:methionyl-tRNA formyltransferase